MAVAFGGVSAHRLFTFPDVIADPVRGVSRSHLESRLGFRSKGVPATCVPAPKRAGPLAAITSIEQLAGRLLEARLHAESTMLFTIAFVLLAAWLVGLLGMYPGGDVFHVFLLVGLMLLLLAFLRARDAALRRPVGGDPDRP